MQTIKKVILVMICFVVLLTSFIQPACAYFDESFRADMVEAGWVYDDVNGDLYLPYSEENYRPSFMVALNEPNFPDFDPTKLPWNEFPDYIQNIAYMGMDDANFGANASYDNIKVPFIMIRNIGDECSVFVGQNLALGTHQTSYAVRLCARTSFINANNSFCYSATFDSNTYEQKSEWLRRTFTPWGDKDLIRYTAATTLTTVNGKFDFYFYGGNAQTTAESSVILTYIYNSDNNNVVAFVNQTVSGFQNSSLSYEDRYFSDLNHYNYTYASYFQPPSPSQIEAETQKGMWESIKELPTKIADSIKGFFTSLGDRISGFFDNLINYLLYFQPTKPDHVNPFADILTDVKAFFDNQMSDVADFKSSLTLTFMNVSSYISTGSGVIDTFLTAVPVLSAFVTFFVAFFIVRKVIGR